MFSHILIPLDGSPLAACGFPHVVAIARATGARVTLLRVLERGGTSLAGHVNPFDWQMQKREGQTYLDEMAEQLLHTVDLPVKTELLEGPAAVQIVEHAQRTGADLVVLSSHGQGGLSGWHTSSVAQKVIQRAGTSVLLARAWRPEASCEPAQWGEQHYHHNSRAARRFTARGVCVARCHGIGRTCRGPLAGARRHPARTFPTHAADR